MEPCVNSKFLDKIRWLIPVREGHRKLQTNKFKDWKKNDPTQTEIIHLKVIIQ